MRNLENKNKNELVENIIVFFLFTVFLVFKSLKTLSKIFTYGIIKKEILTTKSNLGVAQAGRPAPCSVIQPVNGTSQDSRGNASAARQVEGSTTQAGTAAQAGSALSRS